MRFVPRLAVSAIRGGAGKTTLAIGIIAAWRELGRLVAVFKKGPDFIDAGWLGAAAGRLCYNLDPFLMDEGRIRSSFEVHTADAECALIEGNRGLYDGVDEMGTYSTARLAKVLSTPVVLIVDGTKATGTVAAVVLGCLQYDPEVPLRGVILNNVSSGRHESVIRKAVEQRSGIPVVGAVPRLGRGQFPERHMGLTPFQEHANVATAIDSARSVAKQYLDLGALWDIARKAEPHEVSGALPEKTVMPNREESVRIGVIQDTAFQFYYPDNLEALELQGATLHRINALKDTALSDIDALYIGGGFPETQAAELAANEGFCRSLRGAAEKGLPIYAECGGFIYLGRSLSVEGHKYTMASVLPVDFVLEKKPQAHGYTIVEITEENPFFEPGAVLQGHEFHYSRVADHGGLSGLVFTMRRGRGIDGKKDGLVYKNTMATYTHLHALGTPQWAESLVRRAREYSRVKAGQVVR